MQSSWAPRQAALETRAVLCYGSNMKGVSEISGARDDYLYTLDADYSKSIAHLFHGGSFYAQLWGNTQFITPPVTKSSLKVLDIFKVLGGK
jgi:hypothetical protein